MTHYIAFLSLVFAATASLSAMPNQQYEQNVQDEQSNVVMVGERRECGALRTSAASLEDEGEYTLSSENDWNDKHHDQ